MAPGLRTTCLFSGCVGVCVCVTNQEFALTKYVAQLHLGLEMRRSGTNNRRGPPELQGEEFPGYLVT